MKKFTDWVRTLTAIQWVAGIFLGLVTNAIYDLLKPGITSGAGWVFTWLTLGSKTLQDLAYESAAYNPTALSSLFILAVVSWMPAGVMAAGKASLRRRVSELNLSNHAVIVGPRRIRTPAETDAHRQALQDALTALEKYHHALTAIIILTALLFYAAATFITHSVQVWRIFQANIEMCRPYMTDAEERAIRARFARMTTQDEYLAITADLRKIAASHGDPLPG